MKSNFDLYPRNSAKSEPTVFSLPPSRLAWLAEQMCESPSVPGRSRKASATLRFPCNRIPKVHATKNAHEARLTFPSLCSPHHTEWHSLPTKQEVTLTTFLRLHLSFFISYFPLSSFYLQAPANHLTVKWLSYSKDRNVFKLPIKIETSHIMWATHLLTMTESLVN